MAFEFFRRHQRALIFTAGIFTLLTFSITTSVLGFSDWLFGKAYDGPSMELADGSKVQLQPEDVDIGHRLSQGRYGPTMALPMVETGDDHAPDDLLAALRRVALESGIQVSENEVDRAIDQAVAVTSQVGEQITPTQLAVRFTDSLPAFRNVVREALRIGTFVRLQVMAADVSDAALAQAIAKDEERVTFRAAVLDRGALEEELKKTPPTDEDLQKWIDEQIAGNEVHPFRESTNRVALQAVGVVYSEFDAAAYAAPLEGKVFDDETLKREYELRKATYFSREPVKKEGSGEGDDGKGGKGGDGGDQGQDPTKTQPPPADAAPPADAPPPDATVPQQDPPKPPADPYKPFDEVKEDLRKMLQAEAMLQRLLTHDLQMRMAEHTREKAEARNAAAVTLHEARAAVAKAQAELDAAAADEVKKQALETAKAAVETDLAAEKAAATALEQQQQSFDFVGEMRKLLGEHPWVKVHIVAEPKAGEELRLLGDLGIWETHWVATGMEEPQLSTQVQKTDKAAFGFLVTQVIKRPLKAFADLKEQALADFYKKKADEQGKDKATAFETALLEAAKVKVKDKLDEIEAKRVKDVDEKFNAWQKKVSDDLAKAEKFLKEHNPAPRIATLYSERVAALQAEIAKAADKRTEIEKTVGEGVEAEIKKTAKTVYADVMDAVAAANGFEVRTVGPHSRSVQREPRFAERYGDAVKFLFRDATLEPPLAEIKVGDVSALLDDTTGRANYLAVCTAVEPGSVDQLTRRQLESRRRNFVDQRLAETLSQSFTLEALRQRYKYKLPPEQETAKARENN